MTRKHRRLPEAWFRRNLPVFFRSALDRMADLYASYGGKIAAGEDAGVMS
jgi:hypothetical protein